MEVYQVIGIATLLIGVCCCGDGLPGEDGFDVTVDKAGSYRVKVKGVDWLYSAPISFRLTNGKLYSTEDGSLVLEKTTTGSGEDSMGGWSRQDLWYGAGSQRVRVSFKAYKEKPLLLFGQEYVTGCKNCSSGDVDGVISTFPSFHVGEGTVDLGYMAYGGIMMGDTTKMIGRWKNDSFKITSGRQSGPIAIFDRNNNALFVSPFDQFMAASAVYDMKRSRYSWGMMGNLEKVPVGFAYNTAMYYSGDGINKAIEGWGALLRQHYNKKEDYRKADLTLNYLSYWSDNGAYYVNYYSPDGLINNQTYEEGILSVKEDAIQNDIPYRSVQYSVWFQQGHGGGSKIWNASDTLFKDGMQYMFDKTQWPSTAHNRWWTIDTPYAKQNGGPYDWIIEKKSQYSLPIDARFWVDMFGWSKEWGFTCFMQDWLNSQFDGLFSTTSSVDVARTWLLQMGKGAQVNGLTIQYCMAESRHTLQSLEVPSVTQGRASDDYSPGTEQWRIGLSSMFAWAVGLAPFKDVFWTTSVQPHNFYNRVEPYPLLQLIVSTLSMGPVGPGDKVGLTDKSLLMRCCSGDGLILKPSRPAMAIDTQIQQLAFNDGIGPEGEVWTTYSDVGQYRFGIIFAADMKAPYSLPLQQTSFAENATVAYYDSKHGVLGIGNFSNNSPIKLTTKCGKKTPCLFYTAPYISFMGKDLVLMGDLTKVVPMSPQRVLDIEVNDLDVLVKIGGLAGETFEFSYVWGNEGDDMTCLMPPSGTVIISIVQGNCMWY